VDEKRIGSILSMLKYETKYQLSDMQDLRNCALEGPPQAD
jgi:hypothetical protein